MDGVMLTQAQYARLNGMTVAQVQTLRKEGLLADWYKKPNGRVMIAADARTRFRLQRTQDALKTIERLWQHYRHDYKTYREYRGATREVLASVDEL